MVKKKYITPNLKVISILPIRILQASSELNTTMSSSHSRYEEFSEDEE